VIVKPDAVQRALAGEILARLEKRGLKLVAMRMQVIGEEIASRHYAEHQGKPFYASLVEYIGSGPSVIAVFEGPQAIAATRATMGTTKPVEAAPGTIRGDFGLMIGRNLIHGSDSPESAKREIAIFFSEDELISYDREVDRWVLE
jgi:nucleoside-diphosphate kinase